MRTLLLTSSFFLFVSLGWSTAQPASAGGDKDNPKVQGCLSGDGDSFTLKTTSGKTYMLVGDFKELNKLTGKEISVSGEKGSATDISDDMSGRTGEATSNPTAGTAPTIRVIHATKVADQCMK